MNVVKNYPKDTVILNGGATAPAFYLLQSGTVKIVCNGQESILEKDSFFAHESFFSQLPSPYTATTLVDCNVMVIDNYPIFARINADKAMVLLKDMAKICVENYGNLQAHDIPATNNTGNSAVPEGTVGDMSALRPVKIEKEYTAEPSKVKNIVFPADHMQYKMAVVPQMNMACLFPKTITCPVCTGSITYNAVATSKLIVVTTTHDQRKIFRDFDPLWYNVIACPNCYFADYAANFKPLPYSKIQVVSDHLLKIERNLTVTSELPYDINFVLQNYYLALYTAKIHKANPLVEAKLCMNLAWIYDDIGDDNKKNECFNRALGHYTHAYEHSDIKLTTAQQQEFCLVIAELYLNINEFENALKFFRLAISHTYGVNVAINRKAQDRIMDLRALYAQKGNYDKGEQTDVSGT